MHRCWFQLKQKITMLMIKLLNQFIRISSCSNEYVAVDNIVIFFFLFFFFFFFFSFFFGSITVSDRRLFRSDHVDPFSQVQDTRGTCREF